MRENHYLPLKARIESFFDTHRDPGGLIILDSNKVKFWVHEQDFRYFAILIESRDPIGHISDTRYNDLMTIRKLLEYQFGKSNVYMEISQKQFVRIYFFVDFEAEVSSSLSTL